MLTYIFEARDKEARYSIRVTKRNTRKDPFLYAQQTLQALGAKTTQLVLQKKEISQRKKMYVSFIVYPMEEEEQST